MGNVFTKEKAYELSAINNKEDEGVLSGAWSYDPKALDEKANRWVVEVWDESGELLGNL